MPKQSRIAVILITLLLPIAGYAFAAKQPVVQPAVPLSLHEQACIERLSTAITFRTIGAEDQAQLKKQPFLDLHAFLRTAFPLVHKDLVCELINGYSLLYTWQGSDPDRAPIILMAHQDVVPVNPGTEADWTHPAFSGIIADGYVWGRGTLDLKAGMLAMLEAVEALLAEGYQPQRTIYLAFGHDEEVSGHNGAEKIVAHLKAKGIKAEYVIDEGGSVLTTGLAGIKSPVALVGIAEKGYVSIELAVTDPGGHSSMPPRHTAVGILAQAINRLEDHPFPAHLTTMNQTLTYIADKLPIAKRVIVTNPWIFGPLVKYLMSQSPETDASIRTTTAATMISGSTKENVLPQTATAVINFRIFPGDTITSVTEHVRTAIDDPRVTLRPLPNATNPSPISDTRARGYRLIEETIYQTMGQMNLTVAPYLVLGGSDSRFYTPVAENVYRFLPVPLAGEDLKRFHGTNERIATQDYVRMIRFYAQLIRNSQ